MRLLAHRIPNDTVNAHHSKKQSKPGERAQQSENEPATLQRPRDDYVHGQHTNGLVAINRPDLVPNRSRETEGIRSASRDEVGGQRALRELGETVVNRGLSIRFQRVLL